jgi:hypothetical protein
MGAFGRNCLWAVSLSLSVSLEEFWEANSGWDTQEIFYLLHKPEWSLP